MKSIYKLTKKVYTGKTPSDVYNNLWKISNQLDILLATQYSPNETYYMASRIDKKIKVLLLKLNLKSEKNNVSTQESNKNPKDVFSITLKLFERIKDVQRRHNIETTNIIIPIEKTITPNTVYNALRIVNASLNEILIHVDIDDERIFDSNIVLPKGKTPTDVYTLLKNIENNLNSIFQDEKYDN